MQSLCRSFAVLVYLNLRYCNFDRPQASRTRLKSVTETLPHAEQKLLE